jgi:hypothetical protein
MEENETSQESVQPIIEEQKTPEVGFPMPQPRQKMQGSKLIFIGLGLLVLIGLGIFLFARGSKQETIKITPTPSQYEETITPLETGTLTPTPSSIDKTKVKIEVQNGTGVTGEAAFLQTKLKTAGYSLITVGNATTQDATTTTVTFAKSLSTQIVADITKQLEAIYTKVETKTSSTQVQDAIVITGSRTGVTPKPTTTATPTPTETPEE